MNRHAEGYRQSMRKEEKKHPTISTIRIFMGCLFLHSLSVTLSQIYFVSNSFSLSVCYFPVYTKPERGRERERESKLGKRPHSRWIM